MSNPRPPLSNRVEPSLVSSPSNQRRIRSILVGTITLGSALVLAVEPIPPAQPTAVPEPIVTTPGTPPILPEAPPPDAAADPAAPPMTEAPPAPIDPQALPDSLPVLVDPASRLDAHPSMRPRVRPALRPVSDEGTGDVPLEVGVYDLSEPGVTEVQEPELAPYSIQDPLARTTLYNPRGLAASLYDGIGGVPRPLDFPFMPRLPFPGGRTFHLGPVVYSPSVGGELVFSRNDERRGPGDRNYARANLNANIFAGLGDPERGRFITLDYTGSQTIGLNPNTEDHFDQQLFLIGELQFTKLRLGLGLEIESLSGYDRDVGGQVERDFITVALTSTYQLTPKTSFEWDLTTPNGRYPGGGFGISSDSDTSGYTSTNFINYQYTPKTHFGLGFTLGLLEIDGAERQTYQQLLVRHGSSPTPFFSYSAAMGVEFRDTGGLNRTHPVFVLGAIWSPRPRTKIRFSGEQRVESSASALNANYVSTAFALSLQQLLGERSAVYISGGFENARYESTRPGDSVNRRDRTYLGQVSFSTNVAEHVDLALTLSAARSTSAGAATIFTQIALQARFLF